MGCDDRSLQVHYQTIETPDQRLPPRDENIVVARKPIKGKDGLRQQLGLYHVYYNFCLPHASVRHPRLQPEPTHGTGSAKRWQPRTPAMAAGLTDHVWTRRAVLRFRVPPWPQPAQGGGREHRGGSDGLP